MSRKIYKKRQRVRLLEKYTRIAIANQKKSQIPVMPRPTLADGEVRLMDVHTGRFIRLTDRTKRRLNRMKFSPSTGIYHKG